MTLLSALVLAVAAGSQAMAMRAPADVGQVVPGRLAEDVALARHG
jgi:hypothetical protein